MGMSAWYLHTRVLFNPDWQIYSLIKESGNKGIWIKDLKGKSQLHSQIVTQVIKTLEKRQAIKVRSGFISESHYSRDPSTRVSSLSKIVQERSICFSVWNPVLKLPEEVYCH